MKRWLIPGLISSGLITALMFPGRFYLDTPLIPELMAQKLFATITPKLFSFFIGLLGFYAKPLAFIASLVIFIAFMTALGTLFPFALKLFKGRAKGAGLIYSLAIWALFAFAFLPALDAGVLGAKLRAGALLSAGSMLVLFIIYSLLLIWVGRGLKRDTTFDYDRRAMAKGLAWGLITLGLLKSLPKGAEGAGVVSDDIFSKMKGLSPEVTPTQDFYTVSKNVFDPKVNAIKWSLQIKGLVKNPYTLNLNQLMALPAIEQYATLICISNEVGGDLIGNAKWRGVPLRLLLERAGIKEGASELILRAYDGYSDSFPLKKALEDGVILAYAMNGWLLTHTHGYPARLIVPGIYGMKNVKWLTELELTDHDFKGYWQERGWSDEAIIKTTSRIDLPKDGATLRREDRYIAGIAFAGDRGISKVEVSTDGGATWREAIIKKALSPYSWALWALEWEPYKEIKGGQASIVVRATDGKGRLQESQKTSALPDGASGLHTIRVKVEKV